MPEIIKKGKIVLVIDKNKDNQNQFKAMFEQLGYKGQVEIFESITNAYNFLNVLKDETTKEPAKADLIFGFYETKGTEGMELLEMLAVPRESINLSKVKRTCLQQPVIVCS